jgi:hypothetical protein
MRLLSAGALLAAAVAMLGVAGPSRLPSECVAEGAAGVHCLYRSLLPSAGIVVSCRDEHDCRVGYYVGDPAAPVWITPPPPLATLSRPEVIWLTATLAQLRFDAGAPTSVSYFFEARRRRLSEPRRSVLAADPRRLLLAEVEDRALVVRQVFSGREVIRIERDWAPGPWLGDAITGLHFDDDGRLTIAWLRGTRREAVAERVSVPSFARP